MLSSGVRFVESMENDRKDKRGPQIRRTFASPRFVCGGVGGAEESVQD